MTMPLEGISVLISPDSALDRIAHDPRRPLSVCHKIEEPGPTADAPNRQETFLQCRLTATAWTAICPTGR
jgi:hypothetical protein